MKLLISLLILFVSVTAHAAPQVSLEVSRVCAELMGDVIYFQVDNSFSARERITALQERAEFEAAKGRAKGDAMATKLVRDIKKLHQSQVKSSPYDVAQYKNIVDSYELIVSASSPEARNDPGFLVLDLRYRYLSKTLAIVNDGTIASAPLIRTLEESYDDVERAMKQLEAQKMGFNVLRKWSFLGPRVLNYNSVPIPTLTNNMALKIANEVAGATSPLLATSSR